MTKTQHALLLLFFFLTPLTAIIVDQRVQVSLSQTRETREFTQHLRERLHTLQNSCDATFLLKRHFSRFQTAVQAPLELRHPPQDQQQISGLYKSFLAPHLPPHDLFVARQFPRGFLWFVSLLRLGIPGEEIISEWIFDLTIRDCDPVVLNPVAGLLDPEFFPVFWAGSRPRLSPSDRRLVADLLGGTLYSPPFYDRVTSSLHRLLDFPLDAKEMSTRHQYTHFKREGFFTRFQTSQERLGVYWYHPKEPDTDLRLMVFALLDTTNLPYDFGLKTLLDVDPHMKTGVAFLPKDSSKEGMYSAFFDQEPALKTFLETQATLRQTDSWEGTHDGVGICLARPFAGLPVNIVVAGRSSHLHPDSWKNEVIILTICGVMIIGIIFIFRRIFRGLGPRWGLGFLFLVVFFTASQIPVSFARLLSRLVLEERLTQEKQKGVETLEKNLHAMEGQFSLFNSELLYRLRNLGQSPQNLTFLRSAEAFDQMKMKEFLRQADPRHPLAGSREKVLEAVMVLATFVGEGGRTVGYGRMATEGGGKVICELFEPFLRRVLQRMNPRETRVRPAGVSPGRKVSMTDMQSEFKEDFLRDFFRGILGRHLFWRTMNDLRPVVNAGNLLGDIFILFPTFVEEDLVKYAGIFFWSNYEMQDDFMEEFMINGLGIWANAAFLAINIGEHQKFSYASRPDLPLAAWDLGERVRKTGVPQISRDLEATKGLLMVGSPSKLFKSYILAGVYSLETIFREQIRLEGVFQLLAVSVAGIALLFGFLVSRTFLHPLRRLESALQAISRQEFHRRLDEDRPDEFGLLGRAYNAMAKGLQEGTLLGKFVSSAVLQVLRNRAAYEKALSGEHREITVLFCSLKGFDTYRTTHPVDQVFSQLAGHLEAFDAAVEKQGGIIDKIMGDKIMVFFDHEALGGGENAVWAAYQAVETVFAAFAGSELQPVVGFNSGPAIAGILGARQVHLDYTVIGDAVNLAARLNSMAGKIQGPRFVISGTSRRLLGQRVRAERLAETRVKGKLQAIEAFQVVLPPPPKTDSVASQG
jgi:class 3 adenylate cyclase